MKPEHVRVLGIQSKGSGFASLFKYLEDRGCNCELAPSYAEGAQRFAEHPFNIVLCSGEPGIETLLDAVEESSASVYRWHAVEDGCWWVPVIHRGKKCLGEPALRSSEFADVLTHILGQAASAAGAG